jgi:hypothetical protein
MSQLHLHLPVVHQIHLAHDVHLDGTRVALDVPRVRVRMVRTHVRGQRVGEVDRVHAVLVRLDVFVAVVEQRNEAVGVPESLEEGLVSCT